MVAATWRQKGRSWVFACQMQILLGVLIQVLTVAVHWINMAVVKFVEVLLIFLE